jgi:hypothetical protein
VCPFCDTLIIIARVSGTASREQREQLGKVGPLPLPLPLPPPLTLTLTLTLSLTLMLTSLRS